MINDLRKAALEIAAAGHAGWGNACTAGADAIEALQARVVELDRSETQLIQERDEREEVINALCDVVLGTDRYEWSSMYSFDDAVEEVAVKTAVLDKEVSELYALRQAIAQPATTEWTVIAPDGTRFTGPTPLKAALPASKYRLEIDPVAAVKFMEIIDQEAEKGRQEAEQCMRDYGTLDCPACGGSGHIGDVKQPAQVPAGSIRLWDAQWVSIVNHDNAYNGWSTNDAVNHAVRMTERYIAANVAQNNLPPLPAAQEVKP